MLSELTTIKQNYFAKKATSSEEESEAGYQAPLCRLASGDCISQPKSTSSWKEQLCMKINAHF